jgi:hypothetical protein
MSASFDSGVSRVSAQLFLRLAVVTLVLATADLLFACMFWDALHGVPPMRIFQGIAAGLLGKSAFLGGGSTAALGVVLHYAIMGVMVGVYHLACRRIAVLNGRPWLYGSLYGLVLYAVMNLIVVPLSAAPKAPLLPSWIASSIVVHVMIGIGIALSVRRAIGARKP